MKAAFNGHCNSCDTFKPRCATVYFKPGSKSKYGGGPVTLCNECRRLLYGIFRLDAKHK